MDAIESVQVTLRGTMDKLSSEDFKDFKFHLKTKNEIPWKKLEKADRDETIDLMVQAYMEASGQEVINLLRKMKQNMMANELEKELKLQQASSQPFTDQFCKQHCQELKLFCQTDKELICLQCLTEAHKHHHFTSISQTTEPENFKSSLKRKQPTLPDPERVSGALINVAKRLENFFIFWEKMKGILKNRWVQVLCAFLSMCLPLPFFLSFPYSHSTLDPNTAHPHLVLSEDLTSVRYNTDNPKRFDSYLSVLGSEGFISGTHSWDVLVGDGEAWAVGVMAESAQRKGDSCSKSGLWFVSYKAGEYSVRSTPLPKIPLTMKQKLQRIRVQLDWDRGELSFSDPDSKTHVYTIRHTFTERVFPYFNTDSSLRILPVKPQ